MGWEQRTNTIAIGDQVAYSRQFLQSIACYAGDMPHARGTVRAIITVSKDVVLADIAWDGPDLPERVNVKNLCRVRDIGRE